MLVSKHSSFSIFGLNYFIKVPDEPTIGHIKRDEEDHHAVSVIISLNDSFTLKQVNILN